MTNDHIIKAAKAAGGTTYTNRHHDGTACAFGPEALERFYAAAYRAGMERAAEIAETCGGTVSMFATSKDARTHNNAVTLCAKSIRAEAHAQNQPIGTHKEGD